MEELGEKVLQPLLVNTSAISLASECVRMIMKIDDMVRFVVVVVVVVNLRL